MPKFKTIRIAKVNGGSRLQRVQVLANGKYRFVKNTKTRGVSKRLSITTKTRKTTTRKRRTTRKGDLTLKRKRAYTKRKSSSNRPIRRRKSSSTRRKTNKESMWSNW